MTDLRLAVRLLFKQPGIASLAVIALALGIGLTTTMFSIVNGAVLRGLPFPESDRILHIAPFDVAEQDDIDTWAHTYAELARRQQSFEELAAFHTQTANVVGPDGVPERYRGAWMTANTLRLLKVAPAMGRDFRDEESRPGAAPVVLLGHKVWQERFQGARDVVGQPLRVNGTVMTVVGVMPETFAFPQTQDIWIAAAIDPELKKGDQQRYEVIGRLKPGVSRDLAAAEMATLWERLAAEFPGDYPKNHTTEVKTYVEEFLGGETIRALYTMLAAVSGVLLIACANVANLVLARAAGRTRDMAVRSAIGATRWRLVRQMLAEVLLLSAVGAGLGLGIAQAAISAFNRAIVDTSPPFWLDIRIDASVLAFVTGTSLVAALAAGLLPAWRASSADLGAIMNDEGRSTGLRLGRLSRGLVVAEIALSFGLLVVSGLVIKGIVNLGRIDYGFATTDVFAARLVLPQNEYQGDEPRRQLADGLLERLSSLPGVEGAALATSTPPSSIPYSIKLPGATYEDDKYPLARGVTISPGYFQVLRVGVLQGRAIEPGDRETTQPVAVVNQSFARKYFPEGALGRQFALARGEHQEWRTVVGVVPDLGQANQNRSRTPEAFYLALAQAPAGVVSILLDTAGPPLAATAAVRQAVRDVDANLPIFNVDTVAGQIRQNTWAFRVFGTLFSAFGLAALFLATIGLYGVMSFSVSRRTQEFGVRMALGASKTDMLGMVLRQGLWQIAGGILLGAGLGATLGSAMAILLFQVSPFDPVMFTGIALLLTATGLAACLVPARRAARVDPMVALRYQ
jgi:putative ABC transport system permease protein